jgi:hypothetical protein
MAGWEGISERTSMQAINSRPGDVHGMALLALSADRDESINSIRLRSSSRRGRVEGLDVGDHVGQGLRREVLLEPFWHQRLGRAAQFFDLASQ